MKYRRYGAYKASGVEWLGDVPAHWEVKRLRHCCQMRNEKVNSLEIDLPYLGLENIEPRSGKLIAAETMIESEGTANCYYPGDVLFGKLRPYLAKVLESRTQGICTTELLVLQPIAATSTFLKYYLLTDQFIQIVDSSTYGAKMPRASWEFISNMPMPIPAKEEQHAIAAFLDCETAQIDALIARQERLIATLQEKRQALISHAVTKGLNPHAPLKPSGVEWLGDVPAHWQVGKFASCLERIEAGWTPNAEQRLADDDEWAVVKVGCVRNGDFYPNEHKALAPDVMPDPTIEIKPGDLIMSRANTIELVGSIGLVKQTRPGLTLCDKTYRLILNDQLLSVYTNYLLQGRVARFQIELAANGASASMKNISQESIRALLLPIPPIAEQQQITNYLEQAIARLAKISKAAESAIALLRERRSALVAAAVTGQIDVRRILI